MNLVKEKRQYNKISTRVILLLTIVIIIAMSIFVFKITELFISMAKENYDQMTELVSTYFSEQVNNLLVKIENIQDDFTYDISGSKTNDELEKIVKEKLTYYNDFISEIIIVNNKNGEKFSNYVLDTSNELKADNVSYSNDMTRRILDYNNFEDNYIYSDTQNILMIKKMYDDYGELDKVIGFKINTDSLEQALEGRDYYSNTSIGVFNSNGLIIAHTDQEIIGKNIYELTDDKVFINQIGNSLSHNSRFIKKSKKFNTDDFLKEVYHDYLFVPITVKEYNVNWGIIFDIPSGSFNSMAIKIAVALSLGGIITIFVLIFFTKLIINKELRPITKIVSVIDKATEGDLSSRADIKSNNEIGKIGRELNGLLESMEIDRANLIGQKNEIADLLNEVEYLMQENDSIYFETIKSLANTIDAKDSYTGGHCERVNEYAILLAEELNLTAEQINNVSYAALLHDIGKIGISEKIIVKEGKLTDSEFEEIKKHPKLGYEIIKDINFLKNSRNAILHHHERIDGTGYPDGLKGDELCIEAKIIAIADSFDAMTTDRSYRKALKKEAVIEQLIKNKDYQFDSKLVDILVKLIEEKKININ